MDNLHNAEVGDTLYIAGKMRDVKCWNFPQFFYWQVILEMSGYNVVNPAALDVERWERGEVYKDCHYPDILLSDLQEIMKCDGVFMLKGHEDSPGATAELAFAEALGKSIYYEEAE